MQFSSYTNFLLESNKAGSKFEANIAKNIQKWMIKNGLDKTFKATHYQGLSKSLKEKENLGRDEDYSDIEIQNLNERGQVFFVECKEAKANFVTTQIDINEDYTVTPVVGKNREPLDDEASLKLAEMIQKDEGFERFVEFLEFDSDLLGGMKPKDLWFNKQDVTDKTLQNLMSKYNKYLKTGNAEADCKPFDSKLIREKTRNMLACGLAWRLTDKSRTWDICSIKQIPFFSELIRSHYAAKRIPAKYIQVDDDLFVLDPNDNPLNINCPSLPNDLLGRFDLKFTPRFGTGSMYMTPRSKMLSSMDSNVSFKSVKKWPIIR